MDVIQRINEKLSTWLLSLAGAVLAAMMVLACANMVLRAFSMPILGTYELLGFMGALSTAMAMGATQLKKGHIALTVLAGALPRRVERGIDFASSLLCAAFFALAAWRTWAWGMSLVETGELSETLRLAYHPFVFATALGLGVLALGLVSDAMAVLAGGKRR